MEPLDDFESLLKGASGRYNKQLLTEQSVSKMIDERLTESRKNLASSFGKEITLIVVAILFMTLPLMLSISVKNAGKGEIAKLSIYAGTIFYLLVCLFLFVKLMRLSLLQKGMDIRDYVSEIYKKTQSALQVYLWISNATGIAMIAVLLVFSKMNWYWTPLVLILSGIVMHYVNSWYITRRFGKKLDEMKTLIDAFN
jgi:hypothetical protein